MRKVAPDVGLRHPEFIEASGDADDQGRVDLHGTGVDPSSEYVLELQPSDYVSHSIGTISMGVGQNVVIERTVDHLDPTGIAGTVTVGGVPAKDGWITIKRLTAPPPAVNEPCPDLLPGGTFACRGLAPGAYLVTFAVRADPRADWARVSAPANVVAGETFRLNVDLPAEAVR